MRRTIELHPTAHQAALEHASSYLQEVLHRYASKLVGIKTETVVTSGATSPTIFDQTRLRHVDLIVLYSRGETGLKRWVFSSLAKLAVRHSPVPVLVLNAYGVFPAFSRRVHLLRVLLPVDGSPLSEIALEPTIGFIAALEGPQQAALHLLHVINIPFPYGSTRAVSQVDKIMQQEETEKAEQYLHDLMKRLLPQLPTGLQLTMTYSVVTDTDVVKAILAEAEPVEGEQSAAPYDLIVLATHGRGGWRCLLLGSVTEQLLGKSRLPLLIVCPHEQEKQKAEQGQHEERVKG